MSLSKEDTKPEGASAESTPDASKPDYKKIIADQANKPPENTTAPRPIQLRKKTQKELEEMLTAREKTQEEDSGEDEYTLPHTCRSEYSLAELNNTLTLLPIVRAFNSAEGKIKSLSSEGGKKQSKRTKKSSNKK